MAAIAPVIVVGGLRISGPFKHGRQWGVTAVDSITEETVEKLFASQALAQRFIDEFTGGKAAVDPLADDPDGPAKTNALADKRKAEVAPTPGNIGWNNVRLSPHAGAKDATPAKFNLRPVVEALEAYGLDPFMEIARSLTEKVQAFKRDGSPAIDPNTGEPIMVDNIGGLARAQLLMQLGEFTAPRLKAVEMKVKDERTLTAEQLDAKIAVLLKRDAAAAAKAKDSDAV